MANAPATDVWYYVTGPIDGLGTGTNPDLFAVLRVSQNTCAAVNNITVGNNNAPTTGADLGNFATGATVTANTVTAWHNMANPSLTGISTGCVNNTNLGSLGYYYYQVMAIQ